jgi:hypothetical protein
MAVDNIGLVHPVYNPSFLTETVFFSYNKLAFSQLINTAERINANPHVPAPVCPSLSL